MFNNNYDITNKAYLERVRKNYKIHKNSNQNESNNHPKKQDKNEGNLNKNNTSNAKTIKGNNLDFYA